MKQTLFEDWREEQRAPLEQAPPPATDCRRDGHLYVETVTIWSGEIVERMTWTCTICGDVRGRC